MKKFLAANLLYLALRVAVVLRAKPLIAYLRGYDISGYSHFALHLLVARMLAAAGRLHPAAREYLYCLKQRPSDSNTLRELGGVLSALNLNGAMELLARIPTANARAKVEARIRAYRGGDARPAGRRGASTFALMHSVLQWLPPRRKPFEIEVMRLSTSQGLGVGEAVRPPVAISHLDVGLDFLYHFLVVVRATIIMNTKRLLRTNKKTFFAVFAKVTVMIILHVYIFSILNRFIPPSISVYGFSLGGFCMWLTFTTAVGRSSSDEFMAPMYVKNRINFAAVFFADMCMDLYSVVAAAVVSYLYFYLLGDMSYMDVPIELNVLYFGGLMVLAYGLGISIGSLINVIGYILPIRENLTHIGMIVGFVTSSVYNAFEVVPAMAKDVVVFNPVLHVVEFGRMALSPQYSTLQLTLWYPIAFTVVGIVVALWAAEERMRKARTGG
jgi:capsular polysaccharide transport system permease protein